MLEPTYVQETATTCNFGSWAGLES